MKSFVRMPAGITNVPRWEEHCRKIHARAKDFVGGKLSVIQAAQVIRTLAYATLVKDDPDFEVFYRVCDQIVGLPVGPERQHWSEDALKREDEKIGVIEERWRAAALASAHRLVEKYRWALAAKQSRRTKGHVV